MQPSSHIKKILISLLVLVSMGAFASVAFANHAWANYHWARTINPFTLKLGDNVSAVWDAHLATTSIDWSISSKLDTAVVKGLVDPKRCRPTNGRVEVCDSNYGDNGWLGIASIWVKGDHITKGTVKLNDTYFNTAEYNTPAWRNLVMCQEVGHTFGLNHQDENFFNVNLGTCMDYTGDPTGGGGLNGTLDNEHPNQHDYNELDLIYNHLDTSTTLGSVLSSIRARTTPTQNDISPDTEENWGHAIKNSHDGRNSLYENDLGKGQKMFTFVVWAK